MKKTIEDILINMMLLIFAIASSKRVVKWFCILFVSYFIIEIGLSIYNKC